MWAPFSLLPRLLDTSPHLRVGIPRLLSAYRETPTTLRDALSEWRGEGGLWIAHRESELMGLLRMDPHRTYWRLSSFVVDPAFQGRGVGERMLRVATAVHHPVKLQVKQDNPAQRLYARHGFVADCVSDGRILMTHSLK